MTTRECGRLASRIRLNDFQKQTAGLRQTPHHAPHGAPPQMSTLEAVVARVACTNSSCLVHATAAAAVDPSREDATTSSPPAAGQHQPLT